LSKKIAGGWIAAGHGRSRVQLGLAAVVLIAAAAGGATNALSDTIRIGGTGSALGAMRIIGDEFTREARGAEVRIVPNLGSSGGLKALAAEAIDLAVMSRALRPEERKTGLVALEYGRTPFVFATSAKGVSSIGLDRVEAILSGRYALWPDGTPVRPVLRPRSDGDSVLLASLSPGIKESLQAAHSREGMVVAVTDQDSANELERLPGAFGTSTLALVLSENRKLNLLQVEGVAPLENGRANPRYPYWKHMFIVHKTPPAPAVQRYLDFLQSANGRAMLARYGHRFADDSSR
jgi:phosphate transport system substrate-binding protein